MSAGQIAVQGRRVGAPIVLVLVISAFALGLVAGVGLLRIVESRSQVAVAAGPQIESPLRYGPWSDYVDSTYAAVHSPVSQSPLRYGPWSDYVDSTYAAVHSPVSQSPLRYGPWSDYVDSTYAAGHSPAK